MTVDGFIKQVELGGKVVGVEGVLGEVELEVVLGEVELGTGSVC